LQLLGNLLAAECGHVHFVRCRFVLFASDMTDQDKFGILGECQGCAGTLLGTCSSLSWFTA
jgi:hypothetical protein